MGAGGFPTTYAPPGQQPPVPVPPPVRPVARAPIVKPAVAINPRARAQAAPAAGPFTQIAAPNQTNLPMGVLGRGGPARQMVSALDLSRFFGGVPNP